jgi:hypothetical protein
VLISFRLGGIRNTRRFPESGSELLPAQFKPNGYVAFAEANYGEIEKRKYETIFAQAAAWL